MWSSVSDDRDYDRVDGSGQSLAVHITQCPCSQYNPNTANVCHRAVVVIRERVESARKTPMGSSITTPFVSAHTTRHGCLDPLRIVAGLLLIGGTVCNAQNARPADRVFRKGANITGTTLTPLCLDKRAWHDTLRISLRHSELEDMEKPHGWPDTLEARVVRLADEIRHGFWFPRYQIIAVGRYGKMLNGEYGTLYPDAEQLMNMPSDRNGCRPAGVRLLGEFARVVRLHP
jgi:hypothetical protein